MGAVTYPTLEHVAMAARPYPSDLLEGCSAGLALFSAAFLGHNDAVHFAEAGMRGTCVDINGERLAEMRDLYPADWDFIEDDAWKFAERMRSGQFTWDAVSADTFTGSAMRRSLKSLPLWCSLARKVVTVTITAGALYLVPDGWRAWHYERATGVSWVVLERA